MNKDVIWFSSYPKSGKTWLKIMMESVLLHEGGIATINKLNLANHTNLNRNAFDSFFGINASDLTLEETWEYKREYYRSFGNSEKTWNFVLTHDENLVFKNGSRLFPKEVTLSVIHIVRNPLSVVASLANHLRISIDESIKVLNSYSFSMKEKNFSSTKSVYSKSGSWSSHVDSWINHSPYPVHLIKYEDLVENPLNTLQRLFQFLNHSVSDAILEKAIENSTFKKLSSTEEVDGFREKPSTSVKFFRKGKTDAWREELTDEQIKRVVENHKELMIQLGYLK